MVNTQEAMLRVNDLAILRGYGAFDYFAFEQGQPLFFDDYINRFLNSTQLLGLDAPFSKEELKERILELIKANKQQKGGMRLLITGGYAEDGYTPTAPNFIILQYPLPTYDPLKFEKGVSMLCHQHQRELPEVKTINYITGIKIQQRLKANKADFVLYHDGDYLRESDRSNFFMVSKDGAIVTPSDKILYGITRKQVLEAVEGHFEVEERDVLVQELNNAQELFLTSSTKGAMPVVQVDGQIVGSGEPGPITKKVMDLLERRTKAYVEAHAVKA